MKSSAIKTNFCTCYQICETTIQPTIHTEVVKMASQFQKTTELGNSCMQQL